MKPYLFLLGTVGLLILCSIEGPAQQPNPPGSYLRSCNPVKAEGGRLTATCAGEFATPTILAGEAFVGASKIESFFECEGDISNNKGTLTCNRNPISLKMKNTRAVIDYGMKQVLGIGSTGDTESYYWLGRMFSEGGLQPTFYLYKGIEGPEAVKFFKNLLVGAKEENLRKTVIKHAFKDVYNNVPNASDTKKWNDQIVSTKVGYTEVVIAERQKMNSDQVIRRMTINNAYMTAFGRPAAKGDFDYWMPRAEIFKELVAAQRAWLYSANGQKDLVEMVGRAVERQNGTTNPTLVIQAMQKAKAGKLIYSEM